MPEISLGCQSILDMYHALGCREAHSSCVPRSGLEVAKRASGPEKVLYYIDEGKMLFPVACVHRNFHGPMRKSQMGELASQKMLT